MIVNHNLSAIFANRQVSNNGLRLQKSMEKLSSGMRINRGADDASGLAVSEKMRAQVRGLHRANANIQDGISFIQTAEGYLEESTSVLQRLRELAIQASNGIYSEEDRSYIEVEVKQLVDEIDRVASHAQFNGMNILTGRFAQATPEQANVDEMWIHVGANMDQREQLWIGDMSASGLGIRQQADLTSEENSITLANTTSSNAAIGIIDKALEKINAQRADLGAFQNRLEFASQGVMIGYENQQASESRIRDTNMAEEIANLTTNQILNQTATAMLAQSNQNAQSVLQLLQ